MGQISSGKLKSTHPPDRIYHARRDTAKCRKHLKPSVWLGSICRGTGCHEVFPGVGVRPLAAVPGPAGVAGNRVPVPQLAHLAGLVGVLREALRGGHRERCCSRGSKQWGSKRSLLFANPGGVVLCHGYRPSQSTPRNPSRRSLLSKACSRWRLISTFKIQTSHFPQPPPPVIRAP